MAKSSTSFNSETAREAGKKGGAISKRKPLDEAWRDKLMEYDEAKDSTTLDDIYKTLMLIFKEKHNIKAAELIMDRAFGKSKQDIKLSGDNDAPVVIRSEMQKKFIEGE